MAVKQLKFIKDILTSKQYSRYWPEMVNRDESKREKWAETEIAVDHPLRKERIVRDPTVFTAGLTTNIVGLHCDLAILDDVVVDDSAYTPEGRAKCESQVSYLASILGTEGNILAVGTRYHPKDLYNSLLNIVVKLYNEETGELSSSYNLYELWERRVEDNGDGTGEFLWPRTQGNGNLWFGFNQQILAEKKAQYLDQTKFRAQYYNDPNDVGTSSIQRDMFQYYNKSLLRKEGNRWFYGDKRLNVFCAVDFAFSRSKQADYTALVVVGVDSKHNYYVLDIERFKTDKISDYFDKILSLHMKWEFKKIRAEVTAAQEVIVKDLRENYVKLHGLNLSIEDNRPQGKKEQRIEAALQAKYANKQMYHYAGGNCELLEEELILQNPSHDDIKDCLASCVETSVAPGSQSNRARSRGPEIFHSRFGGIG